MTDTKALRADLARVTAERDALLAERERRCRRYADGYEIMYRTAISDTTNAARRGLDDIRHTLSRIGELETEKRDLEASLCKMKAEEARRPRTCFNPMMHEVGAKLTALRERYWKMPRGSNGRDEVWRQIEKLHKEMMYQICKEPIH